MLLWRRLRGRRKKVSTDGLDTFQDEYPSTDTECFLTTGQQLFDSKRITASLTTIVENKIKPLAKKQVTGIPTILMPYLGKTFISGSCHELERNIISVWIAPKDWDRITLLLLC